MNEMTSEAAAFMVLVGRFLRFPFVLLSVFVVRRSRSDYTDQLVKCDVDIHRRVLGTRLHVSKLNERQE